MTVAMVLVRSEDDKRGRGLRVKNCPKPTGYLGDVPGEVSVHLEVHGECVRAVDGGRPLVALHLDTCFTHSNVRCQVRPVGGRGNSVYIGMESAILTSYSSGVVM